MATLTAVERIIPALDMPFAQAGAFIDQMMPLGITRFKAGLRTIHEIGTPAIVQFMRECGSTLFLDAKLHDTSDTMGNAARAIADQGVAIFNLHASCGLSSMRQAVANKGNSLVLAVTVLTSLSEEEAYRIYGASIAQKVVQFATEAGETGVDGLICSPLEILYLRQNRQTTHLDLYTAGIRPAFAAPGQQKRFTTPAEAIRLGGTSTYLIIGSPLYAPPAEIGSPVEAAKRVIEEVEQALSSL